MDLKVVFSAVYVTVGEIYHCTNIAALLFDLYTNPETKHSELDKNNPVTKC